MDIYEIQTYIYIYIYMYVDIYEHNHLFESLRWHEDQRRACVHERADASLRAAAALWLTGTTYVVCSVCAHAPACACLQCGGSPASAHDPFNGKSNLTFFLMRDVFFFHQGGWKKKNRKNIGKGIYRRLGQEGVWEQMLGGTRKRVTTKWWSEVWRVKVEVGGRSKVEDD
jgi:hypothetical protein